MIGLLERRLDTIVYRAKFVPTVFAARQFVNHGHVKVNGRRVTIPSYRVKVGDLIEVKEKSKQLALVLEATALAERDVPDYVDVDHSKMTAKLNRAAAHRRRAVSGDYGTASRGRILLALTLRLVAERRHCNRRARRRRQKCAHAWMRHGDRTGPSPHRALARGHD